MKCCESTDVGTWTNWLTFEPDPNYSPDAGTGLLCPISYKRARVRGILRRENPTYTYWRGLPLQRRVVLKWFYSLSRRNTFVGGTCAPPSALLVSLYTMFYVELCYCLQSDWPAPMPAIGRIANFSSLRKHRPMENQIYDSYFGAYDAKTVIFDLVTLCCLVTLTGTDRIYKFWNSSFYML